MGVRVKRDRLLDPSLPEAVRRARADALDVAEAGWAAVDAELATRTQLARSAIEGAVTLFAFGKASAPMARAALSCLDVAGGVVITGDPATARLDGLDVRRGGHPDPAPDAVETGKAVAARARSLGPDDIALCLISGGGSAMLELPREGIDLVTLTATSRALMHAGAPIDALNVVRAAMSQLKGGGLGRMLAPARVHTLILSDVPGHPLSCVASGPTMPLEGPPLSDVVSRFDLRLPAEASLPRTPVPPGQVALVADHRSARVAMMAAARRLGVSLEDRPGVFAGDARSLGGQLRAGAWVWGGETTVHVRGDGIGGRNQEVALSALLGGWTSGVLLAFGSDGVDGASSAAGALVDAHAVQEAAKRGLDAARFLDRNDAGTFFDVLGTSIHTGPTGTNVADLLLAWPA